MQTQHGESQAQIMRRREKIRTTLQGAPRRGKWRYLGIPERYEFAQVIDGSGIPETIKRPIMASSTEETVDSFLTASAEINPDETGFDTKDGGPNQIARGERRPKKGVYNTEEVRAR